MTPRGEPEQSQPAGAVHRFLVAVHAELGVRALGYRLGVTGAGNHHRIPVMTNHLPGGEPGSVPIAR
ncbi:MAG TPA: hypothetical protein VGI74_12740 [Streptosporangiaceae bacterium]